MVYNYLVYTEYRDFPVLDSGVVARSKSEKLNKTRYRRPSFNRFSNTGNRLNSALKLLNRPPGPLESHLHSTLSLIGTMSWQSGQGSGLLISQLR